MIEVYYDGSLAGLFAILDEVYQSSGDFLPDRVLPQGGSRSVHPSDQEQPELFGGHQGKTHVSLEKTLHLAGKLQVPKGAAGELYEISLRAYDGFIHAWMSELPIEAEIIAFARKVLAAAHQDGTHTLASRRTAEQVISNWADPLIRKVLTIARQVQQEIHRLMGFLRFIPNSEGVYLAWCEPDYFTLPSVTCHFTLRFGDLPWAIIDEKRRLMLIRAFKQEPQLLMLPDKTSNFSHDTWEELWRCYHQSITNETRNNPKVQRQFMPVRYWKYLSEIE